MATVPFAESIGLGSGTEFDLATAVEHGASTDSIDSLRQLGLTFSEIAAIVISPRSLKHREASGGLLTLEQTDRVLRVGRILEMATRIFANAEKALRWLRMPDDRLQSRAPLQMLVTEAGGRLVEKMLWQIDEGIYT